MSQVPEIIGINETLVSVASPLSAERLCACLLGFMGLLMTSPPPVFFFADIEFYSLYQQHFVENP